MPGTSAKLQSDYPNLNIVFNPEFLTEDLLTLILLISTSDFRGEAEYTNKVAQLYKSRFGEYLPVIQTSYETAELIKYMNNLFFATKVSFLNEMFLISEKVGADWDSAIEGFVLDGRVGHSHIKVPGHDGKKGFEVVVSPKTYRQ